MRALAALTLLVALPLAATVLPQNAEREAEAKAKLEALRAEIATLAAERNEVAAQRDAAPKDPAGHAGLELRIAFRTGAHGATLSRRTRWALYARRRSRGCDQCDAG